MSYYTRCLQTIPGRDAKMAPTMDRAAWLKKYLAVRAAFSFTEAYKAAQAELAMLENSNVIDNEGQPIDPYAPLGCCSRCGKDAWTTAAIGLLCPAHENLSLIPAGHRIATDDEAGWWFNLGSGYQVWITEAR